MIGGTLALVSSASRRAPENAQVSARTSLALALVVSLAACGKDENQPVKPPPVDPAVEPVVDLEATLRRSCVTCHAWADPELLARREWRGVVERMFELANLRLPGVSEKRLMGFTPDEAVEWFEARAPESLDAPKWVGQPSSVAWRDVPLSAPPVAGRPAAVSSVRLLDLGDGPRVVACDMLAGRVLVGDPTDLAIAMTVIAQIKAPGHVEAADLDGDGRTDLLVADLGEPSPIDERVGAVFALLQRDDGFEKVRIAGGLGRVADAQAADFDGDGDLDVVVAAFGWFSAGEVLYLENRTEPGGELDFGREVLDERDGALSIPVADVDGDGHLDAVALYAQEHETAVAFLWRAGHFVQRQIFRAPHPLWGHNNMSVGDLDGDGDPDLILANGDTLDATTKFRPYQGVAWLENLGDMEFVHRPIGLFYGAHMARPLDVDGDGDLDVVASALLPSVTEDRLDEYGAPSLAWFERGADGGWTPHAIRTGPACHASFDAADLDGDGRQDLIVGNFFVQPPHPPDGRRPIELLLSAPE